MKPGKVLFTSILLLIVSVNYAFADQKGLFLLENLSQSVEFSYQFGTQSVSAGSSETSSSQNRFQEYYNFDINYAIYNPRILKGRLSAKARADQEYFSTSQGTSSDSSSTGILYNVYGIFLERGYTPFKLSAASELTHVQSNFSAGYDINVSSYGVGASVRNRIVPIAVDYSRYTTETTGLSDDRIQTNNQVSITATNAVGSLSQTDLAITHSNSESHPKNGGLISTVDTHRSFEAALKNALASEDNKYALRSSIRAREEVNATKTSNFSWQESFAWRLGRALNFGLGVSNDLSSQESSTGADTSRTSHSGNVWLSHQLYQNLTSRLDFTGRQSDLENGKELEYGGTLGFNYTKLLPRDARFTLSWIEQRTVVDRSLTTGEGRATDEPLTARLQGPLQGENRLKQPNVIATTPIIVRDANPFIRFTPYVEGVDYEIIQVGAFTELDFAIPGSQITEGKNLLISYSYLLNPSIKYETISHGLGTSISLTGGHKFYASIDQTSQELISGRTELLQLNDSTSVKVGVTSAIGKAFFGIDDTYVDSTLDKHNSVEGFLRYSYHFPRSVLLCQLRDRYATYWVTEVNRKERSENTFNASANYSTSLFRNSVAIMRAAFTDSRGGAIVRDDAELGVDIQWGYGKLNATLMGKLNWRSLAGTTALENQVNIEVKRYF